MKCRRREAQTCVVGMSADMIASWEPVRRQDSPVLQMIKLSSQPKPAYGIAGQPSFDPIPLPVVQSLRPLALIWEGLRLEQVIHRRHAHCACLRHPANCSWISARSSG